MKYGSIIQMKVWNSYEGLPWEMGVSTHTVIQFIDIDGRIASLVDRIRDARRKRSAAEDEVANSQGYRRRFWSMIKDHYATKNKRLTNKGRKMVLKMLQRPTLDLDLKSRFCTQETFEQVTPIEVPALRSKIRDAVRCEIWEYAA